MQDDQRKREEVRKVYKESSSWQKKVDKMSDAQIAALYIKFSSQGRLRP